eukprot:CAMPEP_0119415768 /NCGR_PEP_ID=MMETSP1335-20130426/10476_1 /TAXON_ID=259385 /ORGANISM="Chrysoculter rhomboideus, Strain RCC1486" /LENGTH=413 /DNA_ID=CAMNT_0007440809 /DNA_START=32 /DNA_END=1271 /DNA_ORIENTATION=+
MTKLHRRSVVGWAAATLALALDYNRRGATMAQGPQKSADHRDPSSSGEHCGERSRAPSSSAAAAPLTSRRRATLASDAARAALAGGGRRPLRGDRAAAHGAARMACEPLADALVVEAVAARQLARLGADYEVLEAHRACRVRVLARDVHEHVRARRRVEQRTQRRARLVRNHRRRHVHLSGVALGVRHGEWPLAALTLHDERGARAHALCCRNLERERWAAALEEDDPAAELRRVAKWLSAVSRLTRAHEASDAICHSAELPAERGGCAAYDEGGLSSQLPDARHGRRGRRLVVVCFNRLLAFSEHPRAHLGKRLHPHARQRLDHLGWHTFRRSGISTGGEHAICEERLCQMGEQRLNATLLHFRVLARHRLEHSSARRARAVAERVTDDEGARSAAEAGACTTPGAHAVRAS